MLEVNSISVLNTLSTEFLLIKWTIADTSESLGNYSFKVHRSLSPSGDYELISGELDSLFEYMDYGVNLYEYSIKYYYKVEVVNKFTGEATFSTVYGESLYSPPDNIANAIIYHENMLLTLGDNPGVYVLTKKRFGPRCHVCWDPIQKKITKSQCPACYETTFDGGYTPPIKVRMSFTPTEEQERMAVEGITLTDGMVSAWMANYPLLAPGDVVVDSLNQRYQIVRVVPATRRRYIMHQVLALQKIPPTGVAYKIPVPPFEEVDFLWQP